MHIGIFYGSIMGNTEAAAHKAGAKVETFGAVTIHNIADAAVKTMMDYDLIILGASTWGLGDLPDDWVGKEDLHGLDLTSKRVAVFGTGNQEGYPDTFVDAIGILAQAAEKAGATLIGSWPTDGYNFENSRAVRNGLFLGLPLDDDNQAALTEQRITKWCAQLREEIAS